MPVIFSVEGSLNQQVNLEYDIYEHIGFSLNWLETVWVDNSINIGIDETAISIVTKKQELKKLKDIVSSWYSLFQNSIDSVDLLVGYDYEGPYYESYKKEIILNQLGRLKELCDKAYDVQEDVIIYC